MKLRSMATRVGGGIAVTALALSALVAGDAAEAQSNPYERGPNPTALSIRDNNGPFRTATESIWFASGFGGGTIYYPTDSSQGTFGGVVLAPGFTASAYMYSGVAERVASHGFVVLAMDTNTILDFPDSRGRQIQAALDYLTDDSGVANRVDSSRLAAAGHSMGGGGTLRAANDRPSLQAAVPLQPWHSTKSWRGIRVPTMIIGAQNDLIASVSAHSERFYDSMSSAPEKAFVELRGASHFAATSNGDDQGAAMVSWLKRYVDDDTRYEQFLCPGPGGLGYSEWQHTCPG